MDDVPIGHQAMLVAGATASVPPDRLPGLLRAVQKTLAARRETYRRTCERVHETDDAEYFLVESDHWGSIGDEEFSERELDAVRRAHDRQLLHEGRRVDRRAEFEAALEVREAVVIGR